MLALLLALAAVPTLSRPGEFEGKKLLIANYYTEVPTLPLERVPPILRKMGFTVDIAQNPRSLPALEPYEQLWIISGGGGSSFGEGDTRALRKFLERGKGVYVLADNTPYTTEMNVVSQALHRFSVAGDYMGMKMVTVMSRQQIQAMIAEATQREDFEKLAEYRRAGYFNGTFYAEDHELLTGIERIYEGGTICHPDTTQGMKVVLSSSNNLPLVFLPTNTSQRMIYDCGWTRLYHDWDTHAESSTRWYQNVAAYLMGKRRADLPQ